MSTVRPIARSTGSLLCTPVLEDCLNMFVQLEKMANGEIPLDLGFIKEQASRGIRNCRDLLNLVAPRDRDESKIDASTVPQEDSASTGSQESDAASTVSEDDDALPCPSSVQSVPPAKCPRLPPEILRAGVFKWIWKAVEYEDGGAMDALLASALVCREWSGVAVEYIWRFICMDRWDRASKICHGVVEGRGELTRVLLNFLRHKINREDSRILWNKIKHRFPNVTVLASSPVDPQTLLYMLNLYPGLIGLATSEEEDDPIDLEDEALCASLRKRLGALPAVAMNCTAKSFDFLLNSANEKTRHLYLTIYGQFSGSNVFHLGNASKFVNVESLYIGGTKWSDGEVAILADHCPKLRSIFFDDVREVNLRPLFVKCRKLHRLGAEQFSSLTFDFDLPSGSPLRTLDLRLPVPSSSLSTVIQRVGAPLHSLTIVIRKETELDSVLTSLVKHCSRLQSVQLRWTISPSEEAVSTLINDHPALESIYLCANDQSKELDFKPLVAKFKTASCDVKAEEPPWHPNIFLDIYRMVMI